MKRDPFSWAIIRLRHMGTVSVWNRGSIEIKIHFLLKTKKDERRPKVYTNMLRVSVGMRKQSEAIKWSK